jgi:glutamyl-tRNA reductase
MELFVLGANHTTAPVDVRDALAMDTEETARFVRRVREHHASVAELVVLSTCNRTEIYGATTNLDEANKALRDAVGDQKGVTYMQNGDYTYLREGRGAARHLFRVASGLDSLMLGEPQILGQVKNALLAAEEGGGPGATLMRLFQCASHAGKRTRTETAIGRGALSVAYAGVAMATKVFGDLSRHRVLVVGAGETGALAGKYLAKEHPEDLVVVNRTHERAVELAKALGGRARAMGELDQALLEADVVVTATASPEPLITTAMLEPVIKARRSRPLVLVDVASPRDVDPGVGRLDSVFLYDLDALEKIVEQNRAARAKEIPKAERIVEEELDFFFEWYETLAVTPMIRALRHAFEEIGQRETLKHAKHFHRSDREMLERYTRSLINKLLHRPTIRIKELDRSSTEGITKLSAVQDLFQLHSDPSEGSPTESHDKRQSQ